MEKTINKNGIGKKIREYVKSASFSNEDTLGDDLHIFEEGILDSMGLVGLISFLEENFNIQISDTDLTEENFESIKSITNFVFRHLQ